MVDFLCTGSLDARNSGVCGSVRARNARHFCIKWTSGAASKWFQGKVGIVATLVAIPCLYSAPLNDAFVVREFVAGGNLSAHVSTVGAGADWNEPAHAGNAAGSSVWWSWTPGMDGTAVIDTKGSDFDTVLAVYEGKTFQDIEWVTANDDAGLSRTSRVTFNVRAGNTYLVAVDGFGGATGSLRISGYVNPGAVIFSESDRFEADPVNFETPESLGAGTSISGFVADGHADNAWRTLNYDPIGERRSHVDVSMGLTFSVPASDRSDGFFLLFYNRFGSFLSGLEFDLKSGTLFRHDGKSRFSTNKRFPAGRLANLTMQIDFGANTWVAAFDDATIFAGANFHSGGDVVDLGSVVLARVGGKRNVAAGSVLEVGHFEIVGAPDDPGLSNSSGTVDVSPSPDGVIVSWEVESGAGEFEVWRETADGAREIIGTTSETSFLDAEVQTTDSVRYKIVSKETGLLAASGKTVISKGLESDDALKTLSTRGLVRKGNPMIMGFVLKGEGSRRFLLRAIGPGLAALGVEKPLAATQFSVQKTSGGGSFVPVSAEAGWDRGPKADELSEVMISTGAFALPKGSRDAATVVSLDAGAYTAAITEGSASDGVALFEIYSDGESGPSMSSFSTRGYVGTGQDALIGGLVVEGSSPRWFLIRGVGPSLAAFGLSSFVANPVVSVHGQGNQPKTFQNDVWWEGDPGRIENIRAAELSVFAFPLQNNSEDAAMLVKLNPGVYTVQLNASPGTASGDGLIEIYLLD